MKILISFLSLFFITSTLANDYIVKCTPWEDSELSFSLNAEVELTGGNYTDAWVSMKVFESGREVKSMNSIFSFGVFFIDMLEGKRVLIFELKPAGGQSYKYDFLSLAANHPTPTGNSYLTYNGRQYQAECLAND